MEPKSWIDKIWKATNSFPAGSAVTISLVSFFIMNPENMYQWAVKSDTPKDVLIRRAFSGDEEALTACREAMAPLELDKVDIKSELNFLKNENVLLRESNDDLRVINTELKNSVELKNSYASNARELLDAARAAHEETKQQLSVSAKDVQACQIKLNEALARLRIPAGHTVAEDGSIRDMNGKRICREVVVEPTVKVGTGNGGSSTTFGKYRDECLMSNGSWLPVNW